MDPALTLSSGDQTVSIDDDECVALSEMNFLFGSAGARLGRLLVSRATLSQREVVDLATFLATVRGKLDEALVVYDHGHGRGTVCFQNKRWYELVKQSSVRYLKPTPRYVKGERGKLAAVEPVVYVCGRSVTAKDPSATPQVLRDVRALMSALEKLGRVVTAALEGAPLSTSPRVTYEYF